MNTESDLIDPKRIVERSFDKVAHEYARLGGQKEWPRMRLCLLRGVCIRPERCQIETDHLLI